MNRYLFLFIQFFKIALFVVGGGLAMLPVIEQVFVKKHNFKPFGWYRIGLGVVVLVTLVVIPLFV